MFLFCFLTLYPSISSGNPGESDSDCKNMKGLLKKKKKKERGGGSHLEVKRAKELELVVVDKKGKKKGVKGT